MHISETRIMKIQKMVMEEFDIPTAIVVHGLLSQTSPWDLEETHGQIAANHFYELQEEYQESLKKE